MRKIEIHSWEEEGPEGQKATQNTGGMIRVILMMISPQQMPRGLESFRTFSKITKALDDSEGKEFIFLEDPEFSFLSSIIQDNVPADWGGNPDIFKAVEAITEAETVNLNKDDEAKTP